MPAVVTKRCGNVKGRPLAVYVATIAFTGVYVIGNTEPCDLSNLGLGITLEDLQAVEGRIVTSTKRYDVVFAKGTTWVNGTIRLFIAGIEEIAAQTVTSVSGHLILYTGRSLG